MGRIRLGPARFPSHESPDEAIELLHERITGIQRLGVAVALAGVAVVSAA